MKSTSTVKTSHTSLGCHAAERGDPLNMCHDRGALIGHSCSSFWMDSFKETEAAYVTTVPGNRTQEIFFLLCCVAEK